MRHTDQKTNILYLLYIYRFLNRNQIQSLLHHKQFNRVIIWLNELTNEGNIRRYYNPKWVTVPAVYSLGVKGRKYLKDHTDVKDVNPVLLDRIWRERNVSTQFRKHCQFIADIYLSLTALTEKTKATLHFYTKTSLYGMQYLILPNPDAYFSITEAKGNKAYYFLDIFDDLPARMALRKRIRQYIEYYENDYWQDHTRKPFPNIILVAPDDRFKSYLYRQIPKMLDNESELHFYLSTWEKIKTMGICKETLQKVELQDR